MQKLRNKVGKQYSRTPEGLVDALFDELQDLRDGVHAAPETNALAKLAEIAVRAMELDLREREMVLDQPDRAAKCEHP